MTQIWILTKIWIFDPKFEFLTRIWILTQIWIFDQNLIFLTKIWIFDPTLNFWPNFEFFYQNFKFLPKIQFLTKISILNPFFHRKKIPGNNSPDASNSPEPSQISSSSEKIKLKSLKKKSLTTYQNCRIALRVLHQVNIKTVNSKVSWTPFFVFKYQSKKL